MNRQVKCYECGKGMTLQFPDEFEGHPITTYEQIHSYAEFRKLIKGDYSFGCFVRDKEGNEAWLCPECNAKSIWYATAKN